MKITIAGNDFGGRLDAASPLRIERRLNVPSVCEFRLCVPMQAAPARFDAVSVDGDDGTRYFSGYIAASPMPEYAGDGFEGPVYRTSIKAVSGEILLDQGWTPWDTTTRRTVGGLLTTEIDAAPLAGFVHRLDETECTLTLADLHMSARQARVLANDVTACGEREPTTYITEYFLGDGLASQFNLAMEPWLPASGEATLIHELFNEPAIDAERWSATGGQGYIALGANGLALNGGNGLDGETVLSWNDPIEMGGTLLMEATGVSLAPGSTGVVAGFFLQAGTVDSCMTGFQVNAQPGSGSVSVQPLVMGSAAGSTFAIDSASQYALRVRVHCPEVERSRAMYRAYGDDGAISAGGEGVLSPGQIQMEIQQFVNGVAAMPVTLYEGSVANLPGFCMAVPASSANLCGSMRAFRVTNLGTGWVTSTPLGGGSFTRRVGSTDEAAECVVERSGKVTFYPGAIPAAGELVAVNYRAVGRAVGRCVNAANQAALSKAGLPAVVTWMGSVTRPRARSSADCRNAARVLQEAAASVSALWEGSYRGNRRSFTEDVWPGDALQIIAPSTALDEQVIVQSVTATYRASVPDNIEYEIAFANDALNALAISTSDSVPSDVWLPAPVAPTMLQNPVAMNVTQIDGSTVTLDMGTAPPLGGGFEVRMRDNAFMAETDSTLVTRTPAQLIRFWRTSYADRYYVRMYDDATPPNYSEFSAAVFVNLPLSA